MSGANVMTYYVVYVFEMAGLTGNINLISSGVQYALFIIFTSVIFFYIDKAGRCHLLIFGAIGMGTCQFVVGGLMGRYGKLVPGGIDGNANVIIQVEGAPAHTIIAFCYILIIIYALTLAPVAWVYAAEVWSLETRATGMALAAVANWLFNFALGLFVPPALRNITYKIFIVFGVLCLGAAVQAYFTYPETCGKTQIELMFSAGGPKPWNAKPGGSRLDAEIQAVIERKALGGENYEHPGVGDGVNTEEKGTHAVAQHSENEAPLQTEELI